MRTKLKLCIAILLCVGWPSVALAQDSTTNEDDLHIFSKRIDQGDKKWMVSYRIKFNQKAIINDGKNARDVKGYVRIIEKIPLDADGKLERGKSQLIWYLIHTGSPLPDYLHYLKGDALFDEETGKLYVVIASVIGLEVYSMDWDNLMPLLVDVMHLSTTPQANADSMRYKNNTASWRPPILEMLNYSFPDSVHLKQNNKEIILSAWRGEKAVLSWQTSQNESNWKLTKDVRAEEKAAREKEALRRKEEIEQAIAARKRDPKYQFEQQLVYREDLPYSRYEGSGLSVVRRREKIEPLPAVPPDARPSQPKRVDIIDFRYSALFPHPITEFESHRRLLWTRRIENFANEDAPNLTVFDMDYDRFADVMTVVFREKGVLRADVVRDDPRRGRIAMPLANTRLELKKLDGQNIEKAIIKGSYKEKTLTIVATHKNGKTVSWLLRDGKWQPL